nr:hypothetical protein [Tanacetum cinerariifolium]
MITYLEGHIIPRLGRYFFLRPRHGKSVTIRRIHIKASLAYLKLSLGSSIYRVWKQVDTPYQAMWDMTYWGFLKVFNRSWLSVKCRIDDAIKVTLFDVIHKPEPSYILATQVSDSDSSRHDLKKYDNIVPLTERQLVKNLIKASIEGYYEENVNHGEKTDKVIDAPMNSLDKNNIARGDLLNALNGVTKTLKAIQDQMLEGENVIHVATKEPPYHTEGEIKDMLNENKEEKLEEQKMAIPLSSVKFVETPTLKAQPISTIIPS